MKKAILLVVIVMSLISCGGSTEVVSTDSTVVADSSVLVTDSTVAEIPADSVNTK